MVSIGESFEGCWTFPDEPTWRLTDRLGLFARCEKGVPVVGVDSGKSETLGVLGERDGTKATSGIAPDLARGDKGVTQPRQLGRDEAAGYGADPLLGQPVVVRPDAGEAHLWIGQPIQCRTGKAENDGGERHGRPHAVKVHVLDPLRHVDHTGAELVVSLRSKVPFRHRPADGTIQHKDLLTHVADDPPRDALVVEFDGRHAGPVSAAPPGW